MPLKNPKHGTPKNDPNDTSETIRDYRAVPCSVGPGIESTPYHKPSNQFLHALL